jgi:hypothetical protein
MKKNHTKITFAALLLIGSSFSTELKALCAAPAAPTAPDVSATYGSSEAKSSGYQIKYFSFLILKRGTFPAKGSSFLHTFITLLTHRSLKFK